MCPQRRCLVVRMAGGGQPSLRLPRLDLRSRRQVHVNTGEVRRSHPGTGQASAVPGGRGLRAHLGLLEAGAQVRVPRFDEFDDSRYRVTLGPVYEWRSSAHRRMENFVDFSHFAWVHDGVLGSHDKPEVPDHDVWRDGAELRFTRSVSEPVAGFTKLAAHADLRGWVEVDYDYVLSLPLTVRFCRTTCERGDSYVLMMAASPTGPKVTRSFWLLARNYAMEESDEEFLSFERLVQEQDRPIVESQRPEMLPFDLSAELHIRGVDKVSVEYRRWLVELSQQLEPAMTVETTW